MSKRLLRIKYLKTATAADVQIDHLYGISRHNFPFLMGELGQPAVWIGGYQIKNDGVTNILVNNPIVVTDGHGGVLFNGFNCQKRRKSVTDVEVWGIGGVGFHTFLREGAANGLTVFAQELASFEVFMAKGI